METGMQSKKLLTDDDTDSISDSWAEDSFDDFIFEPEIETQQVDLIDHERHLGSTSHSAFSLLSQKEAMALSIWILQGIQLVDENKMFLEIYILITSFMAGVSLDNTVFFCNEVNFKMTKAFLRVQFNSVASFYDRKIFSGKDSKELFEKNYFLAKAKDTSWLKEIMFTTVSHFTPISLLAAEGDHESIKFLLDYLLNAEHDVFFDYFPDVKDACISGYNQIRKQVLIGYAIAGYENEVNKLLGENGFYIKDAITGYGMGCHENKMNRLVLENFFDENKSVVIHSYISKFHVNQVNKLISQDENQEEVWFRAFKGRTQDEVLQFITYIDDNNIRKNMLQYLVANQLIQNESSLIQETDKMNWLVKKCNFNYKHAKLWLSLNPEEALSLSIWILQGIQLVQEKKMQPMVYRLITARLLSFSPKEVADFLNSICLDAPKKFWINDPKISLCPFSFFSPRAEKLFLLCELSKTKKGLMTVLDAEEKDQFYDVALRKNHLRLQKF